MSTKGKFVVERSDVMSLIDRPPLQAKLYLWLMATANFKDRATLSRGQLVTTIAEMREAMSYRIGYRKVTPTIDEIRSCYEALAKAIMITTTKTTRGLIVTICDYNNIQKIYKYEDRSEDRDENAAKTANSPHYTELMSNECNKPSSCQKPKKTVSDDATRLSNYLAEFILQNNPSNRSLVTGKRDGSIQKWAADIDKLIRIDKQPPEVIETVIRWSHADSFWFKQIQSGENLRDKWDKLTAQMQPTPTQNYQAEPKKQPLQVVL